MRRLVGWSLLLHGCYLSHGIPVDEVADAAVDAADAPLDAPWPTDAGPTRRVTVPGVWPRLGWDAEGLFVVSTDLTRTPLGDSLRRLSPDLGDVSAPVSLGRPGPGAVSGLPSGGLVVCGGAPVGLHHHAADGAVLDEVLLPAASCHHLVSLEHGWAAVVSDGTATSIARFDARMTPIATAPMGEAPGWTTDLVGDGDEVIVGWVDRSGAVSLRRFDSDAHETSRFDIHEAGASAVALARHDDGSIGVLISARWSSGVLLFARFSASLAPLAEPQRIAGPPLGALSSAQVIAEEGGWGLAWVEQESADTVDAGVALAMRVDLDGAPREAPHGITNSAGSGDLELSLLRTPAGVFAAAARSERGSHEIVVQQLPWR